MNSIYTMAEMTYDIVVIGAGSGGLSVGLFMSKAGFKVLMISRSDKDIGGDCLNDGCVPSKALIHVARIAHQAKLAQPFGVTLNGNIDLKKVVDYIYGRQEIIRKHENAAWLRGQGIDVALGEARFTGKDEVEVDGKKYHGKKIVIATGSKPRKLSTPGIEMVTCYDNESIFAVDSLPKELLVIGGGPISIEIAQAMNRLGSKVTVIHKGSMILEDDDKAVTEILLHQLQNEGITFHLNASADRFASATEAIITSPGKEKEAIRFDAIFAGIGRALSVESLAPQKAGISVNNGRIITNTYLQTTNKNVFVCGDVAGDLQFSHAAEFHARIILNNFFSPVKKKLNNDHMSWVTFTDPEVATFGLNEKQLIDRNIPFERTEQDFRDDDRAVTDDFQYGKLVLFLNRKGFLKKQKILGGTMICPHAGEIIQELILANSAGLSINDIFNKIYPYPTASRVNQLLIVKHKEKELTETVKAILKKAYKIIG